MSARAVCRCGWTGGPYTSPARAAAMAAKHVCPTATGIRRATRRYRCARCGYEATYTDASAAEARYWFGRHSCRKHEDLMVRAAHAAVREQLVDRTPKPCLHKQANHQHGERATYAPDRCRCLPCSKANAEAEQWRERQKAYGRYHKYVPAEFVRDHLAELAAYGIGLKRVSTLSGVSNGSLTRIVYGTYASSTGPNRRVLRSTAEAVYTVEAIPANLGARRPDHERTRIARAHLRALVALGWSMTELGRRLGMNNPTNAATAITSTRPLARSTVDKGEALFAELCMTLPPETNQRQRISATRARNHAQAHGWLPPLALDDLAPYNTDDDREAPPRSTSDVDEAAILRRLNGDRTIRLRAGESAEVVRQALARGMTATQIQDDLGIKPERYVLLGEQETS